MWDIRDMGCLGCGIFEMWDVWDIGCLWCVMFGMWDVRNVGCVILDDCWDVGVGLQNTYPTNKLKVCFESIPENKNTMAI